MQRESVFVKRYNEGMKKDEYWEPMYEDAPNLLAKLPSIAAYIYRMKYKADIHIPADPDLDMGGNFAHMMGFAKPYDDVARMYFILHSDHESGNVSAHTTHLVRVGAVGRLLLAVRRHQRPRRPAPRPGQPGSARAG